jgi:hypothetical protein
MNYCRCGCGKSIGEKSKWAKGHNPNKTKDRFDWSTVVKDYKELGTLDKVAEKYNCTYQAVYYQLQKRGIEINSKKLDYDQIKKDYSETRSVCKVAKIHKASPSHIAEILRNHFGMELNHDNKDFTVRVGIGRYGEKIALSLLKGSKDMNKRTVRKPYDILWRDMRVEVKTSLPRRRINEYTFNTKGNECDLFMFICLNPDHSLNRVYLVPSEKVDKHNFRINTDKFNNNYEVGA